MSMPQTVPMPEREPRHLTRNDMCTNPDCGIFAFVVNGTVRPFAVGKKKPHPEISRHEISANARYTKCKNPKITKNTKITRITNYELCKLYILHNKILKPLIFLTITK